MLELIAIGGVFLTTYLILLVLGPRPKDIFISIQERERWSHVIGGKYGGFLYISNVVATLTSLATVYVFFIGTTQLFGAFIVVSLISILSSGVVTLHLTQRLLQTPQFERRLQNHEATAAAITSLFWSEESRKVSHILQILTQVSILCILWLEFATLAKLFSGLLGFDSLFWKVGVMFVAVFLLFDFVFRNGLRGFLFADVLHFPLILAGIVIFLIGTTVVVVVKGDPGVTMAGLVPKLPLWTCLIFVAATLFLNSFLLITSEAHWLRVWTMRKRVNSATGASVLTAAGVWLVLIVVGLMIVSLTDRIGWEAVVDVVGHLKQQSIVFSVVFWISVVAAIFSTADTQLYSFLVISAFSAKDGTLHETPRFVRFPFYSALLVAFAFSGLFWLIEVSEFPFEPIVFFVFPIFLCSVPAFVELAYSGRVRAAPILISVALYVACGIAMAVWPTQSFPISLAAPLMPAGVSLWLYLTARRAMAESRAAVGSGVTK